MNTLNSMLRSIPLVTMVVVALLVLATGAVSAAPRQQATDATLSALTVNDGTSDVDLNPGFTSAGTSYRTAVKYRGEQLTVTATKNDTNATIVFLDQSDAILDDADSRTAGHQVDVPVGDSMFKIKVTAQNDTFMELYEVTVERDDAHLFGWTPTRDLNGLEAAGNASPQGIWSDGTTMWVADDEDDKLYAYTLATGVRDEDMDIMLASDNGSPKGIWSDGTTMWVSDDVAGKLIAYNLKDDTNISENEFGNPDTDKDITLASDNDNPAGIWSDGTTIWVANNSGTDINSPLHDDVVFAYTLIGGMRDMGLQFVPDVRENSIGWVPVGIWGHDKIMFVTHTVGLDHRVDAYTIDLNSDRSAGLNHGKAEYDKRIELGPGGTTPVGIWSDGKGAVWITALDSTKVESYHMLPFSPGSTTLSALTINDGTSDSTLRPAFVETTLTSTYRTSVTDTVYRVTVTATPSVGNTAVAYLDADGHELVDADNGVTGFQVNVVVGTTPIQILVTPRDGIEFIHKGVVVERDSGLPGGRTPTHDLYDLDSLVSNYSAGIWSDGTTMWLTNDREPTVYAYTLATSTRDTMMEFELTTDNDDPWGIWSDGTTMWVIDTVGLKLYAYPLSGGARDVNRDIMLASDNDSPKGIWSDGTTIWVVDDVDNKLYAYTLKDDTGTTETDEKGQRDMSKEFNLASDNGKPAGIWSDGTTVWVGDTNARKLIAYAKNMGTPDPARDITLSNGFPHGVWGQGSTIWVADPILHFSSGASIDYHRVYSYRLPPSSPTDATTLSSLSLSYYDAPLVLVTANLRPTFSYTHGFYRVAVPNHARRVTVTATPSGSNTTLAYWNGANGHELVDADIDATGHQVDVAEGETAIDIRLTSGGEALTYTVVVERDSAALYGWTPTKDFNNLLQHNPALAGDEIRGVWTDDTTIYIVPLKGPKVFAYTRASGARIAEKDINIATNQDSKAGIWSDGTTMWVLNYTYGEEQNGDETSDGSGKVFAFNLMGGTRDAGKDFPLHLDTTYAARGIWSDGSTVWVSDYKAAKLFAYTLATGERMSTKDITLHPDNAAAQGIWSDGTTIWVVQFGGPKFFAYTLATGVHDPDKDFDRVPGNHHPRDVWSDGTTLFVPEYYGQKLFSYRMTENDPATGAPGVSGTAQVGQELTATTGGITDMDGKTKADNGDEGYAYTYQWISVDETTETDIAGATSKTYALEVMDEGKQVKVKVVWFKDDRDNAEGPLTSAAYPAGTGKIAPETTNTPPVITTTSPLSVAENTREVATLAATDADTADSLTWSKNGGSEADRFELTTGGALTFVSAPDHETPTDAGADNGYEVNVRVSDGTANTDLDLTINVTDQNEPPLVMNKPVVTATANSTASLEVSWTEPSNPGRPRIGSYDLQYRVGSNGGFINGPQDVTGSSAAIGNLTADTSYEVRVRATNAEGDGVWSPSGTGQTNAEDNAAPGVTVSETALTVTEEDPTGDSYTVVLDSQPTADVDGDGGRALGYGGDPDPEPPDFHHGELANGLRR